jgi:hypothetical protein
MNTFFALLAEFETADIPLDRVCDKYMGMDYKTALRRASTQQLPVPVYKTGSQKSPWLVSAKDLAEHIDKCRAEARRVHHAMQGAA